MTDTHGTGDLDGDLYQSRPSRLAMLGCAILLQRRARHDTP